MYYEDLISTLVYRYETNILLVSIYTSEDLKWDTPRRGVFQIVTDI
jgi:hypothetical protein